MPSAVKSTVTSFWKNRVVLLAAVCVTLVVSVALQRVSPHVVYGGIGLVAGVLVWQVSVWLQGVLWHWHLELHPQLQPIRNSLIQAFRSLLLALLLPISILVIAFGFCNSETNDTRQFVEIEGACGERVNRYAVCGRYEEPPREPGWYVYSDESDRYRAETDFEWNTDIYWEVSIFVAILVLFIAGPLTAIRKVIEARRYLDDLGRGGSS